MYRSSGGFRRYQQLLGCLTRRIDGVLMTESMFPRQIETERLRFEQLSHKTVDLFDLYEFVQRDDWQDEATEHMPWFRFKRLDEVARFIDHAEEQRKKRDTARYLLRATDEDNQLIGLTAFGPEWETRRAGSGIVLAQQYWGNEYGLERAQVFIELTFERYDLDAFYTTCATDNEPSRRMIEKYVGRYGGQHEGVLRQHSARPSETVADQHRFTILRDEYEQKTQDMQTMQFDINW
ncbi:Protein N-acetyltransferase, RimJ/RimL family [Haloferax larsenii]|uniref:Protein N-acetyltransferase, RimJ/RimL family n=2 Tax=Haloferax larsenii TaxID=302484 RepID=A0A1H7V5M9_HALLR|nr:Protein N-acetyltransferase, RimJ/RimL family [Haloferax larsenii]